MRPSAVAAARLAQKEQHQTGAWQRVTSFLCGPPRSSMASCATAPRALVAASAVLTSVTRGRGPQSSRA